MRSKGALAMVFFALAALSADTGVQTIMQRSVAANRADWEAEPQYSYFDRVQEPGNPTKTYHVLMIDGSPYQELVAVNGKALSQDEQTVERQKLEKARKQRGEESQQDRAKRIADYENGRKLDHMMIEQLTEAFDFKLQGRGKLDGRDVYVLQAEPRRGYKPPNAETEALTGMQGKLWIDQKTFQWVKVDARVVRAVSIDGFIARVEPGTHFELEKTPVADGVWLPKHFAMKSQARVLLLFRNRRQEDDAFYGYQPAGAPPVPR